MIRPDGAVGSAGVFDGRKLFDEQIAAHRTRRRKENEQPAVRIKKRFGSKRREKADTVGSGGDGCVAAYAVHEPALPEIDHIPETDHHEPGRDADQNRFSEILAGAEGKPFSRRKKAPERF